MKTITVINLKGGVGKSVSIETLAHMLATVYGQRVLTIDLDPQGNLTSAYSDEDYVKLYLNGVSGKEEPVDEYTVGNLLLDSTFEIHKCIKSTKYQNVDILPSNLTLARGEELLKADITSPQQFRLKMHLEKIKEEYDICLIDCSPSLSILNINALTCANEVYIPTRVDGGSLLGVAMTLNLIKEVQQYAMGLKVGGVFFTAFNKRKHVSKDAYALLAATLPSNILLPITIGITKYLELNSQEQKQLLEFDEHMQLGATKSYLELAQYMLAKNKKECLITLGYEGGGMK
ncbi:MAG: AAA family ATPase [Lachnospiraceae bacterium]